MKVFVVFALFALFSVAIGVECPDGEVAVKTWKGEMVCVGK